MELEKASLEEKKKGIAVSEAEIAQGGKSTLKAEMDKARTN